MEEKFQYRLTKNQKEEIAQNLIDLLQKDSEITEQSRIFIGNWILTDASEKRKAFFDVWDIVLKNYLPATRPILFRACDRISKSGKIASFTGSLEFARKYCGGKGNLIICDTKETLLLEEQFYQPGQYRHTFYPIVTALKKAKICPNHIVEDEYIMRIHLGNMHSFKWIKNDL